MKKIITACVCLLLLLALSIPALAEGTAAFAISPATATLKRGETVTLTVNVKSDVEATTYGLVLDYDKAAFELSGVSSVAGAAFQDFNDGFAFMFQNPTKYTGTVGTVTLKVKDTAPIKAYTISGVASVKNGSTAVSATGASVAVTLTCDHTYGDWTKGTEKHSRTCTACGHVDEAEHGWDDGKVEVKADCMNPGTTKFTCKTCGAEKTQEDPITGKHTYGEIERINEKQHKKACKVCKEEVIEDHDFRTTWSKDGSGHWHECRGCYARKDAAQHKPGPEATETKPQTCTVCQYVIKAAQSHVHSYAKEYTTDEKGHWYKCSGCEEKGSYAAHKFDSACDPDCACGYVRIVEHTYETTLAKDATHHWLDCTGCGHKEEVEAHIPGPAATATTAQVCTTCGWEIAPATGEVQPTVAPTQPVVPDTEEPEAEFPMWILLVVAVVCAGSALVIIFRKGI